MAEANKWIKIVVTQLLASKGFDIEEINDFEEVKDLFYDRVSYKTIVSLINEKDWEGIKSLGIGDKKGFGEFLSIIKFTDQNKSPYVATIYDSDELWQDPEIVEIFPLT